MPKYYRQVEEMPGRRYGHVDWPDMNHYDQCHGQGASRASLASLDKDCHMLVQFVIYKRQKVDTHTALLGTQQYVCVCGIQRLSIPYKGSLLPI